MHKLSLTVAILGLLAPWGVNALGVGDIKLRSGLNQSLDAEIPLVLSGNDSLNDVKISLASPEAFARAGVDRQYFLTKLQFQAVDKGDGSYAIRVTSRDVIQEPFLSFLVEVNWPQGRMLKEFTALLDPPAVSPETVRAPTRAPVMERPVRPVYPSEPPRDYRRQVQQQTVAVAPPPRRNTISRSADDTDPKHFSGEQFGPVPRRETLWGIARQLNQDPGLSNEQMAMALYRHNPSAFFAESLDSLKAGATLRIPNREFIAQLPADQAAREFYGSRGGHPTWPTSRPSNPTPAPRRPVDQQETAAPPPRSELKLLPPETGGKNAGGPNARGKSPDDLALEVAETARQENDDFRNRLQQMEQKLAEMQRVLVVKDQQIANLQNQQRPADTSGAQVPTVTGTGREPAPTPEPVAQQPGSTPETNPSTATNTPPPVVPPAQPQPPRATIKPRPVQPPQEHTLLDELLDNAWLIAAGGGALLLAVSVWMIARRRAAMIAETESILIATERETAQQKAHQLAISKLAAANTPKEVEATKPKSSILSEFTTSDFDALGNDVDEVDPISEADVYLAYGRYKQAEDLIRNASDQHPGRDDFKLKLLEIHYATENRPAFQDYARQLAAQGKDQQPAFWGKVLEMGHELCPEDPMFVRATPAAREFDENTYDSSQFDPSLALSSMDLSDDIIEDLKRFEIELLDQADFDSIDTELEAIGDVSDLPAANQDSHQPLDFEPGGTTSGLTLAKAEEPMPPPPAAANSEADNLIAFDFAKPRAVEAADELPETSVDDFLRELQAERASAASKSSEAELETVEDMHDLDFQLDLEPVLGELSTGASDGVEGYTDLTDMDEIETKLDLAKAYAEMEDEDSARDILEDVLSNGNDAQKAEARSLLDQIRQPPQPKKGRA